MYLIDTNILIWVLRGSRDYIRLLHDLKQKGPLAISVITIGEIYQNIKLEELKRTEELLDEFQQFVVDAKIASESGLYWQKYVQKRTKLTLTDCMIAATAREYDCTLV